jgi:methionine synthase II (cobalamin-independent)
VGVVAPRDPRVESPVEVRERVLEAAAILPIAQLGPTDDCGLAPFSDERAISREVTFVKISARFRGTELAAKLLERS